VNKHGNGIRCDLVAVQFAADDTAFGEGAADASSMFGSVGASPAQAQAAPGGGFGMPAAPFAGLPSFLT
jgi:hypothetical protein